VKKPYVFQIGRVEFDLTDLDNCWVRHEDGEGMGMPIEDLETSLEKWFNEEF